MESTRLENYVVTESSKFKSTRGDRNFWSLLNFDLDLGFLPTSKALTFKRDLSKAFPLKFLKSLLSITNLIEKPLRLDEGPI